MAISWEYIDKNIVKGVERFKVPEKPPRFLSQQEIGQLLDAARESYIYPLIVTALHTGMRKSELLNLKWSGVDFEQNTITIQSDADWHTKNYKSREVEMTPVLRDVLQRQ
jgi:integrase